MTNVHRAAGTAGMLAALLFVILLGTTFTYDPAAYTDPARALAFAQQAKGLRTIAGISGVLSGIVLVIFFAGLADRLATTTPLRAMLTRNFGIIGAAALALGSLVDWAGISFLASFSDQVAAQHAWVALFAMDAGIYGLTGAFLGIAVLAAGSAMVGERLLSRNAGWVGIGAAAVIIVGTLLQAVLPPDTPWLFAFYIGAGILFLIWFAWTGTALRRAA
jgi:hypothetical protein